jgi:uncharacterized protein YqhQ
VKVNQPTGESDENEAAREASAVAINLFSRVIAVLVLAILPIVAGYYLDRSLSTHFFIFFAAGLLPVIAVVGLLWVARLANRELRMGTRKDDYKRSRSQID